MANSMLGADRVRGVTRPAMSGVPSGQAVWQDIVEASRRSTIVGVMLLVSAQHLYGIQRCSWI